MNMYPQADSVIRTLIPAMLDVAGMREVANKLRKLGPVISFKDAESACILLSQVQDSSDEAVNGWSELVKEAAFWAEGAVHSALNRDKESFSFCVGRVRAAMDQGWILLRLH